MFADLSVEDNLRLGAFGRSQKAVQSDLEMVFDLFARLRERQHQAAGTLSGGEQQMVAIGRAMMGRPQLLMLDEPSMGLAPLVTAEIFRLISRLQREMGISVLLVEQNARAALRMSDRAYVLSLGQRRAAGGRPRRSARAGSLPRWRQCAGPRRLSPVPRYHSLFSP